jgi:hypothetical protein
VDGRWRSRDGAWTARGQAIGSTIQGGPERTFPDGTKIRSGDTGGGLVLYGAKEGGGAWIGELAYDLSTRRLDHDDLGYMPRQNQQGARASIGYRTLQPWGPTLNTNTRLEAFARKNLDGLDLGSGAGLATSTQLKGFWRANAGLQLRLPRFDDREVGDGTALERAGVVAVDAGVSTDPRARVSGRLGGSVQRVRSTWGVNADATLQLRPLSRLDLELTPQIQHTRGEPRYAGRGDNPNRYLFGNLDALQLGGIARATYTFVPNLSLQGYAQLFFARGQFTDFAAYQASGASPRIALSELQPTADRPASNPDFVQAALNLNLVLRWEYQLGSTVFLVYTRSQAPVSPLLPGEVPDIHWSTLQRAPAADVLMLKLTSWWG